MRISETLAEVGHRVTVICKLAPGLAADERINGVRYVRVPMRARPLRPRSGVFKFSAFESFVEETVLTLRPTILHANDLIARFHRHREKRRTITIQTGVILVARGLMNPGFETELRLDRVQ